MLCFDLILDFFFELLVGLYVAWGLSLVLLKGFGFAEEVGED